MLIKKKVVGIRSVILLFFILVIFFQSQFQLLSQRYNFRNYSVEDGMSQSQVYSLYQCTCGYLWCGLYGEGLNRFDGKNFVKFSTKDGLSDDVIYAIIEDKKGNLWFGTEIGVNKFDGKNFIAYTKKDGLIQNRVHVLLEDNKGSIWVGTESGGISCFKDNRFISYTTNDGLVGNSIRSIIQDKSGFIWIGTTKGLSKFNGETFENCYITEQMKDYSINCILEDHQNNYWFATNRGIFYFKDRTLRTFTVLDGLCNNQVNYIFECNAGFIWIATNNGINRLDLEKQSFSWYTTHEGLPHPHIRSIIQDREGNIWFATELGISKFRGETFTYFNDSEGLRNNMVWSIWESPNKDIWFGTEKGIDKYSKKDSKIYHFRDRWTRGEAYPFYEDRNGMLWLGNNNSLIKYDGSNFRNINEQLGVNNFYILSIYEDQLGNLWLGTRDDGAIKYDGKKMVYYTVEKGLLDNSVNTIFEDSLGNIWMGTNEGISIYIVEDNNFINITTSHWLTNKYVMTILQDHENHFWIATYGSGIIRYTMPKIRENEAEKSDNLYINGTSENITTENGLLDDEVISMIFDDNNHLYLGTNKGIAILDTNMFNQTGKKFLRYYGRGDGFIGIECNQNSIYKDSEGNLWFGTIRGAIKFNPKKSVSNSVEPIVHITNIQLFYQEDLGLPEELELTHNKNHLTFNFIGISLTVPEKVKYKVKLEGFDNQWSPAFPATYVRYSNLPPNRYIFKVKACNNEGIWNQYPTEYRFTITPAFWQTWWFYLLALSATIASILGFIKLRTHSLNKQRQFLEDQVHLRTVELEKEKNKVEQINQELEQRVNERTRKLAITTEKLFQAQRMEAIGTLASGVAHDLNNILAGIINYPELLLMDLPEDSPYRGTIIAIRRTGLKAAAIVQDLLTLARRGLAHTEIVNLNHIITEFIESPESKKIMSSNLLVDIETNLENKLYNIIGSSIHLSKAIMNLVSNAVEAMPNGGKLSIETKNISLQGNNITDEYQDAKEGDYAVLKVSDTGIGLSKNDMKQIFEPFYTKKKMGKSGTGLGMTIVLGTVQDHNGYISVQSSRVDNKGTTFILSFPATKEKMLRKNSTRNINGLKGNGECILVVDDVEEQRKAATMILRKLGYQVHSVPSGEEAINYLLKEKADLLVLDMIMEPGISGLETYKQILKRNPKQKIIIVSGYMETEDIKEAQKMGAGAFIKKPFDLEKLGMAVKEELTKNK